MCNTGSKRPSLCDRKYNIQHTKVHLNKILLNTRIGTNSNSNWCNVKSYFRQTSYQLLVTTNLDCLFFVGSSTAKTWTVPWSLDTQRREESWLKLMLYRKKNSDTNHLKEFCSLQSTCWSSKANWWRYFKNCSNCNCLNKNTTINWYNCHLSTFGQLVLILALYEYFWLIDWWTDWLTAN